MKLITKQNLVHVTSLSQIVSETSTHSSLFHLCSRLDPCFKLEVWAPVLKTLPSNLPLRTIDKAHISEIAELELADPHFEASRPIDILIGVGIGPSIFNRGDPVRTLRSVLAQNTVCGWIIGGPIAQISQTNSHISLYNMVAVEKLLRRFWDVEDTPKKMLRSEEDTFL